MNLTEVRVGGTALLSAVRAPRELRRRLLELGFVPGRGIRVLGRGATGGLLLALGDARLALDVEACRAVLVSPAPVPA
ncbi:FeoA domain-containing protein [Plantactinospora siamensis]|uniref:FeoA domain-containing protein n=1 Tax=Plantactinospora siamensis TaxID=555372 RepID=A0ABV6NS74_9ACTN